MHLEMDTEPSAAHDWKQADWACHKASDGTFLSRCHCDVTVQATFCHSCPIGVMRDDEQSARLQ